MHKRKPPSAVYFTSLEVENIRCFGDRQPFDLTADDGRPARWTLIIGDNGVGKTTLLQCLAWMRLVPANYDPALLAEENDFLESLLRQGCGTELALAAKFSAGIPFSSIERRVNRVGAHSMNVAAGVRLFFNADGSLLRDEISPNKETTLQEPLFVTYGANRYLGAQNLANSDLDDPIASRLSGRTELYDVEEILGGLDYASKDKPGSREHKQLERLRQVLAKILPEEFKPADIEIFPPDVLSTGKRGGVHLRDFSGLVPLSALSLGYQTTLAWTTDLAWRLLKRYEESPDPLSEPAIVLIDEIDLHLHPRWQLRIIDKLSAIFCGTQFVATAHSPLMVQVAESANLVLLRKREVDVEIVNEPEVVRSWRVDQILTSELFNVPRARDPQTERLFERRDELVDKPSRTAPEEAELIRLRTQISELPTAQDPKDQEAMEFIRKAAALLKKKIVAQ